MTNIIYDTRINSTLNRFKALGYKFHIEQPNNNEVLLVIDMNSVIQRIQSLITYPKKEVKLEDKYLLIHFWKGDTPEFSLYSDKNE
jgi:hypothetical protein